MTLKLDGSDGLKIKAPFAMFYAGVYYKKVSLDLLTTGILKDMI